MHAERDPGYADPELDPVSALLDQILAAEPGEQREVLAQLCSRHPDRLAR